MKKNGIKIKKENAERFRKYLIEQNLLIKDLKINKDEEFVYFPVNDYPNKISSFEPVKMEFEKTKEKPKSYKDIALIPAKFKKKLPTSYDVIGDILIIKIPKELMYYKRQIGKALMKVNKNITTVCHTNPVTGEFRTHNLEVISGKKSTFTIHKEYGLNFYLDISKAYFSPRLSEERKRIADLVKTGEIVIDMFAGIAPFSIMIAKYAKPKIVYAFDKNKDAINYALENIRLNKVIDKIEMIHADSKDIKNVLLKKVSRVDRIIMNLPFTAHKYFPNALSLISDRCVIHYYTIIEEKKIKGRLKELEKMGHENKILYTECKIRKIKTYSPREFYIGIDITAKKKMPM